MLCRPIYTRSQITTEYTQITSIPSLKPESGLKITRRYYKDNAWMNQRYNKKAVNLGDQILHIDDLSSPCKDHEMDIDDMLVVLTEDTVENESEEMLGNNTVVSIDSEGL